jgi:hypothetical protein
MSGQSLFRSAFLDKTIFFCLLLVPLAYASNHDDWKYEETHSDSREFVSGGHLRVRMSVGDLHIRRGNSNKLSLRYTVKSRHERNVKDAHVDFDVHGSDATIEFHSPMGGNTNFDVELEVPANTNLDVNEKVGDLIVEDVEGDKDLDLGVGDIRVGNGHSNYHLVRASTGIGDVNADITDNERADVSGWLGKTLHYHGDGKYELHAHVGVGDITLEGK